jgi:hypothetical protein
VNIVPTVCPYGCQYVSETWHAENCPGPPPKRLFPPVFRDEPEYQREREADELERRREEAEDERTLYPEKGLSDE